MWDIQAGYVPLVAREKWCFHVQRLTSLSWSADDRILASGADDSMFLWSLQHKMTRVPYP
jgi:WD40 repeat protein